MRYFYCLILLLFVPLKSLAHPVTFEGGTVFMGEVSAPFQSYSLAYSPKYWLGAGLSVDSFDQQRVYSSVHLAMLVKRWNLEQAQGNFYVFGGPGHYTERIQGQVIDEGGFTRMGVQLDFETRRIYTNARYVERRTFDGFESLDNIIDVSAGFAPYLAKYTDLNSWVILRYMNGNRLSQQMVIPMAKFFYKNYLWEFGVSTRGDTMFNFMVHF